jgi:hypothetical protein
MELLEERQIPHFFHSFPFLLFKLTQQNRINILLILRVSASLKLFRKCR